MSERHMIEILNQNIAHGLALEQMILDCKWKLVSGVSMEVICLAEAEGEI